MRKARFWGLLWTSFILGKARKRREWVRPLPGAPGDPTMRKVGSLKAPGALTAQVTGDQQFCWAGFVCANLAASGVIIQVGRWRLAFMNRCLSCFSKGEL